MQQASHSDMMFDVCERLVLPFVLLFWMAFHVGMKNCPVYIYIYIYIYIYFFLFCFFSSKNITQRVTH